MKLFQFLGGDPPSRFRTKRVISNKFYCLLCCCSNLCEGKNLFQVLNNQTTESGTLCAPHSDDKDNMLGAEKSILCHAWKLDEIAVSSQEQNEIREMALTCGQRNRALEEQLRELKETLQSSTIKHGEKVALNLNKFASKRPVRSKRQKLVLDYTSQLKEEDTEDTD